jgi:LysM repeat protein
MVMCRIAAFIIVVLFVMACNLVNAPPTPTLPPSATPAPLNVSPPVPTPEQGTPITSDCPDTPLNWIAYTVERGDTLSLLAEQTDSTVSEIAAGNCMDDTDAIIIDTVLFLPRVPVISP